MEHIAQRLAMPAGSPEPLDDVEVGAPVQVERVSFRLDLDVAPDGDLVGLTSRTSAERGRCAFEPAITAKHQVRHPSVPVSIYDPGSGLGRMPALCPSPERVPEDHSPFPNAEPASM